MNKKHSNISEDALQAMIAGATVEVVTPQSIKPTTSDDSPQELEEPGTKTDVLDEKSAKTLKEKKIHKTTENSDTPNVPASHKEAKEEYMEKFLQKKTYTLRRYIAIPEETYQKISSVHNRVGRGQTTMMALIGSIVEDHIETHRETINKISKDLTVNF